MLRSVQYALWVLAPCVQVCLIALMWRRRVRREFPVFFTYTVFSVVAFALQFTAYHLSYAAYFYLYWTSSVLNVGIGFAVIYEIFHSIFRPYDSLRELGNVLFKWATIVLVLIAIVGVSSSVSAMDDRIMHTVLALERSIRVMQVGLVLFLLLFAGYVGLTSRSHVFGIALGFGIFAAVELALITLRAAFGPIGAVEIGLLKSGAYNVACVVWLSYLRVPEPARIAVNQATRTEEWNLALQTAGHSAHESFLPMIESAVERVLQKREGDVHSHH